MVFLEIIRHGGIQPVVAVLIAAPAVEGNRTALCRLGYGVPSCALKVYCRRFRRLCAGA